MHRVSLNGVAWTTEASTLKAYKTHLKPKQCQLNRTIIISRVGPLHIELCSFMKLYKAKMILYGLNVC